MDLNLALKSNRMCRSLTGMSIAEFEQLATQFEWNYLEFKKKEREQREKKKIKSGKGKLQNNGGRPSSFQTAKEQLFAALIYLKVYPTFDLMEFLLKVPRSTCHLNVPTFFKILEQTLGRNLVLPKRRISSLEEFLEAFPEVKENLEIFIDGTERPVSRSKNIRTQNKRYSGKIQVQLELDSSDPWGTTKKSHTKKHTVITDKTKKIRVLTRARNGRRHGSSAVWTCSRRSMRHDEKKIADKDGLYDFLPEEVITYQDTGLQGVQHKHKNSKIPHKRKPKSKHNPSPPPLTNEQQEENTIIGSIRVTVEHAIWLGLKRFNIISHKFRNKNDELADQIALLTTGLWNYYLLVG